jgi:dTDP-4-amino-4,6-dideoxygalactose transaminase
LYIVQTARRDELQRALADQGIGTGLHYPLPLHLQEAYRGLNLHQGDFPVAEAAASRIMSLPMYPTLKKEQQERVAKAIKKFVETQAITEPRTAGNRLVNAAA